MGNTKSQSYQDVNVIYSSSSSDDFVLETQSKTKTYWNGCCFSYDPQDQEYEVIEWSQQTRGYLVKKYCQFPWSRPLRRLINTKKNDFTIIQSTLISDITNLSSQYTQGEKEELNIQYNQKKPPIYKTSKTYNFTQNKEEKPAATHSVVEITVPHRANSLLEDNAIFYTKQKENKIDRSYQGFYKNTMEIIERHLKENSNPLCMFLKAYFKFFGVPKIGMIDQGEFDRLYDPLMSISKQSCVTDTPKRIRETKSHVVVEDIKSFIEFYLISLYSFYKLDRILVPEQLEYFNMQNLSSFIMTILFRNDKLYKQIFEGLQDSNMEETDQFFLKINQLKNKRPSYFGVPVHLELMNDTILELSDNRNESNDKSLDSSYRQNKTIRVDSIPFSRVDSKQDHKGEERKQSEYQDDQPYIMAIKQLRKLSDVRSPVHQLKLISKTTDLIQYSINQFYLKNDLKLVKNFGADELVPILCYVIVQSQIKDLGTHLKLIENFTPRQTLNSSSGYKLVTLQNCFFIISHWNEEADQTKELKKNFSESVVESNPLESLPEKLPIDRL